MWGKAILGPMNVLTNAVSIPSQDGLRPDGQLQPGRVEWVPAGSLFPAALFLGVNPARGRPLELPGRVRPLT